VLTIRLLAGPDAGVRDIEHDELFTDYEQLLFTRVVAIAERHGRTVKLLIVPSTNVFDAVAQSAIRLQVREIVLGESAKMTATDQAQLLGEAWDRTPHDASLSTRLTVQMADGQVRRFSLGAHAPDLSPADIERIHRLWVEAVKSLGTEVHHRDIVAAALGAFEEEMASGRRAEAIERLRRGVRGEVELTAPSSVKR
ncbi:MAG TPA: hypothetical protein VNZ26_13055, partial [Vicinamibacterales bacterium]|nr:hypothetical protein [Vicinamibacterales bacterium]